MRLESPEYRDGETIPVRFAALGVTGGTGVSAPFEWYDAPPATRSFVLALIDIHPVARGWVHWLVTDVPARTSGLVEGASLTAEVPCGAVEHPNSGGRLGYGGPQPPVGSGVHDYVANLYALDVPQVASGANDEWDGVQAAMAGHVLAHATLVGRFGR